MPTSILHVSVFNMVGLYLVVFTVVGCRYITCINIITWYSIYLIILISSTLIWQLLIYQCTF